MDTAHIKVTSEAEDSKQETGNGQPCLHCRVKGVRKVPRRISTRAGPSHRAPGGPAFGLLDWGPDTRPTGKREGREDMVKNP